MSKKLVLFVSALFLGMVRRLVRALPRNKSLRLGRTLGKLAYFLLPKRRAIALNNLRHAFPELTDSQVVTIAKQAFANFGMTAAEFLRADRLSAEEITRIVEFRGREHLEDALKQGKGALLITAHFGNWELMARHLVDLGYKLSVVARDADDPKITGLVNEIRRSNGYEVFSRGNAAKFILGCLRRNECVGILPDQNAGDVFVRFFGRECGSVVGPAVIHLRTAAPIIPIFCARVFGNRYLIEAQPPLQTAKTGDAEVDAKSIMQQIQSVIENQIRRHPDQWLWFHDRWKSARCKEGATFGS